MPIAGFATTSGANGPDALRARVTATITTDLILLSLVSVILCAPILSWYYLPAAGGLDVTGHPIGRDFINFWAGPRIAFSSDPNALFGFTSYTRAIGEQFGQPLPIHLWSYPPVLLMLTWPLAQLPYFSALAVWTIGSFTTYAWVTLSALPRHHRRIALVALVAAPATLINIAGGQNGFVTASLFLAAVLVLDTRPVLAGLLLGLLTFKPQLGLVLPFALIALGAWRTIAVATLTAISLYVASLVVLGADIWSSYLAFTPQAQLAWMRELDGFFPSMLVGLAAGFQQLGATYETALIIHAGVGLVAALLAAASVRRTTDPALRALVLASATAISSPWMFNYDLPLVAAAWLLVLLAPRAGATPLPMPIVWLVWCAPALVMLTARFGLAFVAQPILLAGFVTSLTLVWRSSDARLTQTR